MSTAIDPLRFSMESLECRDELVHTFYEHLRRLVRARAAANGRSVVTDEDVRSCAAEAFHLALADLGLPDGSP